MISEDGGDEEESLRPEHPIPNYTALELCSSASTAAASNFPGGMKSSSGKIFKVFFSLFFHLKISNPFLSVVVLPCCCYVMPVS